MASKAIAGSVLVLRIFTLLALVACVVIFVINNISVTVDVNNVTRSFHIRGAIKVTFQDVIAYRYVLSVAIIGAAYSLLQLPFAMYLVSTGKRMVHNGCLPEFDYYGDKVICSLLATGIGAGFAYSCEYKSTFLDDIFAALAGANLPSLDKSEDSYKGFVNQGIIATALLSLGFVFMVILLAISSRERGRTTAFPG